MITIESTEWIDRPVEHVFAFVSDVRNDPQWHTDVLEAEFDTAKPLTTGTTFRVRFKPFMGLSEGTGTVTAYEPPRRVVLTNQMGKFQPVITITVEPDDGGSRITRLVKMEAAGMLRYMAPFMGGMMRKQSDSFLSNLKRLLEEDKH